MEENDDNSDEDDDSDDDKTDWNDEFKAAIGLTQIYWVLHDKWFQSIEWGWGDKRWWM